MIADNIERRKLYQGIGERFAAALEWLATADTAGLAPGKYQVRGDDILAMVQEYSTSPAEGRVWESHVAYADIQCVMSGEEAMGWASPKALTVTDGYSPERDCSLYSGGEGASTLVLGPGDFAVFFPDDAHKPCCQMAAGPCAVRKIVMKVRLG